MTDSEMQLAGLAASLVNVDALTPQERRLVPRGYVVPKQAVQYTRERIRAGEDPLGEAFCSVRTSEHRRTSGATYTPTSIVDAMIDWAVREGTPNRIVDPGVGSGRFLLAAAGRFPHAQLIGVDIDPLATLLLRANAAVLGLTPRLSVQLADYRQLCLEPINGSTLFVGNPPYVRHHDISSEWKRWFISTARLYGFKASGLAGLHIHFFLKTRELGRTGDYGAFITAAEWLDVNYGSLLRKMLADGLGGTALHLIDPRAQPFADTLTTGAVTCFRIGRRPEQFTVRTVNSLSALAPLSGGQAVSWKEVASSTRWSVFTRPAVAKPAGMIELGELFRVHRGTVTGNNEAWIEGAASANIPSRYKRPSITRARELLASGGELRSLSTLKRVIDLPVDLDELDLTERRVVDQFLRWARKQRVHEGYIASHRRAWWAVQFGKPAPILCTYMARQSPAFVRNSAGAYHLNIAHGLYPRSELSEASLMAVLYYLRRHVDTADGRTYAGGLVKFEPKELERVTIPPLEELHAFAAKEMDTGRAYEGRSEISRGVSA